MKVKSGLCPQCGRTHIFSITGAVKHCGLLCSLGVATGLKRRDAAVLVALASFLFGNKLEEWIKARCPECAVALQVITALA